MGPIWGSLRVVLLPAIGIDELKKKIAHEYNKYFDKLAQMLARIGDVLPRFRNYERLFPNHQQLLHSISGTPVRNCNLCPNRESLILILTSQMHTWIS